MCCAEAVRRTRHTPGETFLLPGRLEAEFVTVPGKVPLYPKGTHHDAERTGNHGRDRLRPAQRAAGALYPGMRRVDAELAAALSTARLALFDGTLWADDEMMKRGLGDKTGRRMGHMPVSGADGTLEDCRAGCSAGRLYPYEQYQPAAHRRSPERRQVEERGFEVAPMTAWRSTLERAAFTR